MGTMVPSPMMVNPMMYGGYGMMNPFMMGGYGYGMGLYDGYGYGMANPFMMGGYGYGMGLYGGLYGGLFGYGNRFSGNLFSSGGWVNPVPPTPTPPIMPEPSDVPYQDTCLNGLWGSLHQTLPFIPPPKGWRNRMLPDAPGYYPSNYWA